MDAVKSNLAPFLILILTFPPTQFSFSNIVTS